MKKVIITLTEHGNIGSSLNYFLKFNLPKNVKILDIGCNYGSLVYKLHKLGYKNVYGIDINKEAIKQGKESYKLIKNRLKVYDGENIPFKKETFDVVLMFDVIEHIPNIQSFLKEKVYSVIKKGGIFLFQTPNKPMNILWVCIANKSISNKKSWEEHCSLQTFFSLKRILRDARFKKIEIERHNILTKHNIEKVNRKAGYFGLVGLKVVSKLPLIVFPNLWGSAKK